MGWTSRRRTDHYAVLGVSPDASQEAIARAYRRMALAYHPDRNPAAQAQERFKAATASYAVLSDPARRRLYDSERAPVRPGRGSPPRRPYVPPCWVCREHRPGEKVEEVRVSPAVRRIRTDVGPGRMILQVPRMIAAGATILFSDAPMFTYLMCPGCRTNYEHKLKIADRAMLAPLILLLFLLFLYLASRLKLLL